MKITINLNILLNSCRFLQTRNCMNWRHKSKLFDPTILHFNYFNLHIDSESILCIEGLGEIDKNSLGWEEITLTELSPFLQENQHGSSNENDQDQNQNQRKNI